MSRFTNTATEINALCYQCKGRKTNEVKKIKPKQTHFLNINYLFGDDFKYRENLQI